MAQTTTNIFGKIKKDLPGRRVFSAIPIEKVEKTEKEKEVEAKILKFIGAKSTIKSILSEIEEADSEEVINKNIFLLKKAFLERFQLGKEILEIQDSCVCTFYVYATGPYEDTYICSKCGCRRQ